MPKPANPEPEELEDDEPSEEGILGKHAALLAKLESDHDRYVTAQGKAARERMVKALIGEGNPVTAEGDMARKKAINDLTP